VVFSSLTDVPEPFGAETSRRAGVPESVPEILSTVLRRALTKERRFEGGLSEAPDSATGVLLDLKKERSGISCVAGLVGEGILARPRLSMERKVVVDDGALLSLCLCSLELQLQRIAEAETIYLASVVKCCGFLYLCPSNGAATYARRRLPALLQTTRRAEDASFPECPQLWSCELVRRRSDNRSVWFASDQQKLSRR